MQNKIFVFSIFYLIFFGCSESKETRKKAFLLKGNEALSAQQYELAERYFYESIKIDSCFEDALNNLGTMAFQQHHFDKATDFYSLAIVCNPQFFSALLNRANAYREMGNYDSSLVDISKLISLKPDTAIIYFIQGLVAMKKRDNNLAFNAFSKAIALDSQNVAYFVNRATVNFYRRLFNDAKHDLMVAKNLDSNEGNIYNTLAMIEIEENNIDSAGKNINKAVELVPNQPFFINNRGYIFLMQKKLDLAIKDINHSLDIEPKNGWAIRNLGIYYLFSGDYPKASKLLKQAEEMDSTIDKIHYYLGLSYLKNGSKDLANSEFELSGKKGENMINK